MRLKEIHVHWSTLIHLSMDTVACESFSVSNIFVTLVTWNLPWISFGADTFYYKGLGVPGKQTRNIFSFVKFCENLPYVDVMLGKWKPMFSRLLCSSVNFPWPEGINSWERSTCASRPVSCTTIAEGSTAVLDGCYGWG